MIIVNLRVSVRTLGDTPSTNERASIITTEVQLNEDDLKSMKVKIPVAARLRCGKAFKEAEKQVAELVAARVK